MQKCYLVVLRLPEIGMLGLSALNPVGTLFDRHGRDVVDVLPHIEMVARRSYHKIQAQMDDPVTMVNQFHHFVSANKQEQLRYGATLIGFFPIVPEHRKLGRSHGDNRIHDVEAYLVYVVDDNHEID